MNKETVEKKLSDKSIKMMEESSMVYETYEENFFSYIDGLLLGERSGKEKELILNIATEIYQYETLSKRSSWDNSWKEGLCPHYIEPKFCPAGCGENYNETL